MIPLKDHNPTRTTPYLTIGLIAVNVLVFLTEPLTASRAAQARFFFCKASIPWEVLNWEQLPQSTGFCPGKSVLFSILYSMFLHGGLLHIAGNMLYLWVFGNNVEDRLGPVRFLMFYFGAGIAATYTHSVISAMGSAGVPEIGTSAATPMVGASGAVAGILGAYLLMFPRARIYTLVPLFFFVGMDLPAVVVLGFWFVIQLLSGVASVGATASSGVAFFAHIGGFLAGMLLLLILHPRRRSPPAPDWI